MVAGIRLKFNCLHGFPAHKNAEVRFDLQLLIELQIVLPENFSGFPINLVPSRLDSARASSPPADTAGTAVPTSSSLR